MRMKIWIWKLQLDEGKRVSGMEEGDASMCFTLRIYNMNEGEERRGDDFISARLGSARLITPLNWSLRVGKREFIRINHTHACI